MKVVKVVSLDHDVAQKLTNEGPRQQSAIVNQALREHYEKQKLRFMSKEELAELKELALKKKALEEQIEARVNGRS